MYLDTHLLEPGQEEVINHLMQKKKLLAVMPTGAGNLYAINYPLYYLKTRLLLLLSPLVYMDDQVIGLKDIGVKAERVHSGM